jgi:heat shock protein HslJ
MRLPVLRLLLPLILLLLIVPAFAATPAAEQATVDPAATPAAEPAAIDPLDGSQWRLTQIPGRNLAQVPVPRRPTLAFADGRASGRGVCNLLTATYTLGGPGELRMGRVGGAMTRCVEAQSLERHYISQLEDVTGFSVDGDRLVLRTRRGRELLFERMAGGG